MKCVCLAGLLPLLFIIVPNATAQILEGTVRDQEGRPLADVHLIVEHTRSFAISDDDGRFRLVLSERKPESRTETLPRERSDKAEDSSIKGADGPVLLATRIGYEPLRVRPVHAGSSDSATTPLFRYEVRMQEAVYEAGTLVVTATRTVRDIEEVPIPVTVVTGDEIRRSGSMRLSDVLAEQTGMQLVHDHGSGIQIQGLDPDYTLIMIDGNPVIGRTAGTLDLTRISVGDVEQIEIVKGPSSALWGSEALAGVVNIITRKRDEPLRGGVKSRFGRFRTLDLEADLSTSGKRWRNEFFVNHNRSTGYSLNPNSISQTVPEYGNTTLNIRSGVEITDWMDLDGTFRFYDEQQQNLALSALSSRPDETTERLVLQSEETRREWMGHLTLSLRPASRLDLDLEFLSNVYHSGHELTPTGRSVPAAGSVYESTNFRQQYHRPELKAGYRWNLQHHTLGGTGLVVEKLTAERYQGQPTFTTRYLFLQHSWNPAGWIEVTGGFRYDAHSEYSSQLSPKWSARVKPWKRLQLRISLGRGFKAPDFRQLWLNFTNATEGYTVFGSGTLQEGLERLEQEGALSRILVPAESIGRIEAESSRAINAGFDLDIGEERDGRNYPVRLRVNLFRNQVSDLIETALVARKTNGQSVFTYMNVDQARMQGVEAELSWRPLRELNLSAGYQLLDARRRIERERRTQGPDGEVVTRTDVSMRPMFNRSLHSGTIKLFYEHDSGWGANLRGVLRGRYALYDINGNNYAERNELEAGYTVWNLALMRELSGNVTLQIGADNLFNYRNINQPWLAGRMWYLQASVRF